MRTGRPGSDRLRSRISVGAALAVFAIAALVAGARPAYAHAQLTTTSPANGAVLAAAPTTVTLTFSEAVHVLPSGVRVLDARERRVEHDAARTTGADRRTVALALPALSDGPYVVVWQVVSEDTHPVRGAFTFQVGSNGKAAQARALAARALAQSGVPRSTGRAATTARMAGLFALVVLLGLAGMALFVTIPIASDHSVRRLALVAGAVAVAAGAAGLMIYGPLVQGRGLDAVTHVSLLRETMRSRFGKALTLRTIWLVVLAVTVGNRFRRQSVEAGLARQRMGEGVRTLLVTGSLACAACVSLAGHAAAGRHVALALIADISHVVSAAVWIGGTAVLTLCVLRPAVAGVDARGPIASVRQFSRLAAICVLVLTVTGLAQVWRQVGNKRALTTTTYGRFLLAKVAVVAAVVLAGFANRRRLAASPEMLLTQPGEPLNGAPAAGALSMVAAADGLSEKSSDAPAARRLLRTLRFTVLGETLGGVAIIVLTGFLVNTPPARDVVTRPVSVTLRTETSLVDVTLDPARTGRNQLHLYVLDRAGAPRPAKSISATLEKSSSSVPPIPLKLTRAGPNHFVARDVDVPFAGSWQLDVTVRLDEFTAERAFVEVPVR